MNELLIGKVEDFKDDRDRKIVTISGKEIGVFRKNQRFFAFDNYCPHQGGPACEGLVEGRIEPIMNEVQQVVGNTINEEVLHLTCPWHGWQFDITNNGTCVGNPAYRLKQYEVTTRENQVFLQI